ncbi:MAG: hypothetical protein NMK33_03765 [Candidatus Cardinium sp.]|uniref:hypothetical protein n=1 Tax=Cardinium endosymbiont of Dermatophagoides farinae TaxID=2597823 RepID=UPI00118437FA|nr:hypothetical protein [Cardinium endosymbiont of Dermatophagoides farinae]TSJ80569.1 hypothetical protein FPG78_00525 [Cardinium endosymbiont of Dermatophagoides farinae]UWW96549.1 MAG: hypothetical protein NMK33_03765 [Candidatus Cardinium sp.]
MNYKLEIQILKRKHQKIKRLLICIYDSAIMHGPIRDIIKDGLRNNNIQSIEKESDIYQGKQVLLNSDTNAIPIFQYPNPNKENETAINTVKLLFKNHKLEMNDRVGAKNFITCLLAQEHQIAIITLCPSFLHTTIALLEELGLTENQIKNMIIMRPNSRNHRYSIEELQRLTNTKSNNVKIVHSNFNGFLAGNGYTTFNKLNASLTWGKILKKLNKANAKKNDFTASHIDSKRQSNPNQASGDLTTGKSTLSNFSTIGDHRANTLEDKKRLVCLNIDTIMPNKEHNFLHNGLKHLNLPSYMKDDSLWVTINGRTRPLDVISTAYANYNKDYSKKEVEDQTRWLLQKFDIKSNDYIEFRNLVNGLLQAGHKLAIITFNDYPDSIPILLQKLGLTEDQINRILIIIGGYAQRSDNYAKGNMDHIAKAKELTETDTRGNANVILIDIIVDIILR